MTGRGDQGFFVEAVVLGHPRFKIAGAAACWLWVQCGVWSADAGHDGFVDLLAVRAYGTVMQARRLVEAGLWEEADGGFRFLRWRNGHPTPETEREEKLRADRERAKRYRERQKDTASAQAERHVERDDRHVTERDASRDRHAPSRVTQVALDTTSSLVIPPLDPPQGGTDRPPKRARAVTIPASWAPNDGHRAFVAEHQLNLDAEVVRFRDHHLLKGTLGKDWDAGFRTWLRHAVEYRAKDQAAAAPAKAMTTRERNEARIAAAKAGTRR